MDSCRSPCTAQRAGTNLQILARLMMVSMCNNLSPLFTKWSLQWSTNGVHVTTRAMPDVIIKQVKFSAPLRGTRITQQCQMRGRSVIRSVVYEPGGSGCRIGRLDVQRREKEFDENPLRHKSIHFSEGGKRERSTL